MAFFTPEVRINGRYVCVHIYIYMYDRVSVVLMAVAWSIVCVFCEYRIFLD